MGDIADFLDSRRKPVKESDRLIGPYPYYGANGLQGWINDYLFDEDLILLAEDGGHFDNPNRGVAYKITGKTWVNNHAHVIKPKEGVDLNYLCRVLENYDLTPWITGTTRGKLTKGGASEILIPLPSISEQRRIASILDKADKLRQKRQQAIEKLDQLLQATFIDMFGDPVSNPKGWDLKSVGEVSESKLGKMLDKKKQSSEKDQYKYLRNANVKWFKFDLSDLLEMEFNEKDRKNCELKFGDILVCEGGEPGRAAIWKNDLENCFFQKALHRVRLNTAQILPEYFVWLFWFYAKNGGFDDHITVATIAHLTGIKMKAMQIPIPPISLQEEFQKKINEIEVLKTKHESSSKLVENLFISLQNQAFSGNL
nr:MULTISPECIES: restriction endonuclease subunit S [unclassified Acinetobacter]